MDIYFLGGNITGETMDKYLNSCVTVDLGRFTTEVKCIRIWVDASSIDVGRRSLFGKKVQRLLNAHYYEYVIFMNRYLGKV